MSIRSACKSALRVAADWRIGMRLLHSHLGAGRICASVSLHRKRSTGDDTQRGNQMTDRTTKGLLFAIALGLWMNVVASWNVPVQAQSTSQSLAFTEYLTLVKEQRARG